VDTLSTTCDGYGMPETNPPSDWVRTSGVADILGVNRSRVHELAKRDDFPAPVNTDELGRRWDRSAIEAYAAARAERTA